jgi:hypothetical protein
MSWHSKNISCTVGFGISYPQKGCSKLTDYKKSESLLENCIWKPKASRRSTNTSPKFGFSTFLARFLFI